MRWFIGLLVIAFALPAQTPVGRILRIQISNISNQPIIGAKVVAQTVQEAISMEGGLVQLRLPPTFGPGSELKNSVTYKDLVIHVPLNGDVTVPKDANKVVTVLLGPKGDPSLLARSGGQIVAACIRQQDLTLGLSGKDQQEPKLTRYIRQWASEYGYSVEQVQAEVQRWAEEVQRNRASSSLELQAQAAYAKREFEKAADLFNDAKSNALGRLEEDRKRLTAEEERQREDLRTYLDTVIGQADSLKLTLHYSQARQVLDDAVRQVDKARYRAWWVAILTWRANLLLEEGRYGAADASQGKFAAGIRDYRQLLQDLTGPSDRQDWAMTQNNLGLALSRQGERSSGPEGTALLSQAVEAYRAALQVRTVANPPQDWARTQNNLGLALFRQAERSSGPEATALLDQAVEAYRAALQIQTKADLPHNWANAENNLGGALLRQAEQSSGPYAAALLTQAAEAFRAALLIYTKADPPDWAMTQSNLGNALRDQGVRSSGAEAVALLAQAAEAFRASLQVYTKADLPQNWAGTQYSIGLALVEQGERIGGPEATAALVQAAEAFRAALEVYTKADLPQSWAATQDSLGNALSSQSERTGGAEAMALLTQAVEAYRAALQVYTKADQPQNWAGTHYNLAGAQILQGDLNGGVTAIEQALDVYPNNVDVLTRAARIYHDHLFSFDRAFELNKHRVELDGSVSARLDFAEKQLTTARFRECADSIVKIPVVGARQVFIGESLRFACQYGAEDNAAALSAETLLLMVSGLRKVERTFAGTKHFLADNPAFARATNSWVKLFESLEVGDGSGLADAVRQIQKTLAN
jgi:tetratricopeptide (TPR) repeat protein